ncbi:hypothetical protein Q9I_00106, partial [Enterococcus faecalis EnGen0074]
DKKLLRVQKPSDTSLKQWNGFTDKKLLRVQKPLYSMV